MPLAALSHVSLRFGGPLVLDDVTLAVEPGRKVGVIGQNGVGKSTLLRLVAGQLAPTAGSVHLQRGTTISMQAQELSVAPGATVLDHMQAVFAADRARVRRLSEVETMLAEATGADELERLLIEQERLLDEHRAAGGFDVDRRIETVLSSLGLGEEAWTQPLDQFSGGERNIVGLAAVLLSDPDVMLLDEPSNHLDMEGVEWFTDFLRQTRASVVMVSHDRHLLDRTVDMIWEVRAGKVTEWTGNYSAYRDQKAKALELQERRFRNQERTKERLAFQARRLKDMAKAYDDPGQAKRAKAMEKRIERMDQVERPDRGEDRFHASLAGAARHGQLALVVKDFTFGFGDRPLFERAHLTLEYGDRVCLVGPNGSGKSTLVRQILENGGPDHPALRLGPSVRAGEYRQLHDVLDHGASLLDWAMDTTGLARTPAAALLHRFLFSYDDLARPIGTLSGGEKSRLQLARLVHEKVNFLILDEPTNHLDLQACEQLEEMLVEFDGTLLVISHDRYFLERLVDRVVEVQGRGLHLFRGSFAAWWEGKQEARERRRKGALELRSRAAAEETAKEQARREREDQKALRAERRRLEKSAERAGARIEALEGEREELFARMQRVYTDETADPEEGRRLAADLAALDAELATRYAEWERTVDQIARSGPDA